MLSRICLLALLCALSGNFVSAQRSYPGGVRTVTSGSGDAPDPERSGADLATYPNLTQSPLATVCLGESKLIGSPKPDDFCYSWTPAAIVEPLGGGQARVTPTEDVVVLRHKLDGDGNLVAVTKFPFRVRRGPTVTIRQRQLAPASCAALAKFELSASSGSADSRYKWSTGSTSRKITVSGGATYRLTVTDNGRCPTVKTFTPKGEDGMVARYGIVASGENLCGSESIRLRVRKAAPPGRDLLPLELEAPSYRWNTGSTAAVTQATHPGNYRVTITHPNGCAFVEEYRVAPSPKLSVLHQDALPCESEPLLLLADWSGKVAGQLSYAWSTGMDSPSIEVTQGGRYAVTVTDSEGCSLTAATNIADGLSIRVRSATDRLPASGGSAISAVAHRGEQPYTYKWSNGATTSGIKAAVSGRYTVTVTDAAGCSVADEVTILPHEPGLCDAFSARILYAAPDCSAGGQAELSAVLSSGHSAGTYRWSGGSTGPTLRTDLANTDYRVTVTSDRGCTFVTAFTTPDFTVLKSNAQSLDELCDWTDQLDIIPLADGQAMLLVDDLDEAEVAAQVTHGETRIGVEVIYTTTEGRTARIDLPFARTGDVPDPQTWAGALAGIPPGTALSVHFYAQTGTDCPAVCPDGKDLLMPVTTDSVEIVLEEEPLIELSEYDCGDEYAATPEASEVEPLLALYPGDVFFVNGFPVVVQEASPSLSSNGIYSGTGVVPLPFNRKTLTVEFSNARLNRHYHLLDGEVAGVADELSNYDFSLDTFLIGGASAVHPWKWTGQWMDNPIRPPVLTSGALTARVFIR